MYLLSYIINTGNEIAILIDAFQWCHLLRVANEPSVVLETF